MCINCNAANFMFRNWCTCRIKPIMAYMVNVDKYISMAMCKSVYAPQVYISVMEHLIHNNRLI